MSEAPLPGPLPIGWGEGNQRQRTGLKAPCFGVAFFLCLAATSLTSAAASHKIEMAR